MSLAQGIRDGIEEAQRQQAKLIQLVILKRFPTLVDQVDVRVDFKADVFFRAKKCDGGRVYLCFGVGAGHPRFSELVADAGRACYAIRFNQTTAVEMRK